MANKAIIAAVLTVAGAFSGAGAVEASVDGRQHDQRHRIVQGVRSGELTPREAARLSREQAAIRRQEIRYRRDDGRLDARERAALARQQGQASRHIHREKTDRQD